MSAKNPFVNAKPKLLVAVGGVIQVGQPLPPSSAPGKNPGEDIARGCNALSRGPPNGYREGMFHPSPSTQAAM